MRILDRYLLGHWVRIFVLTALGFPLVNVLIQVTDRVGRLLERDLTAGTIALSYLFTIPESMAQMIPAACLFATVFTIGPLARNSELTAAKASGQSFHRLIRPLVLASAAASVFSFVMSEVATRASARSLELQKERQVQSITTKYSFVYRGAGNWLYTVRSLDTEAHRMEGLVIERHGEGPDFPTLAVVADSAIYSDTLPGPDRWRFHVGSSHILGDSGVVATFQFRQMRLRAVTQRPRDLLVEAKDPKEMDWRELGAYVDAMRRSNNDTRKLEVERAMKLAIPATCFVIALFGAPMAMTAPRAGAAFGIAISLGTTVGYLLLVNLFRAAGIAGVLNPQAAAWLPNVLFLLVALVLLRKVRT